MTLPMLALLIAPEPLRTVQVCVGFDGCVITVTEYAALLSSLVPKTKVPLPLKLKESPPLSSSVRPDPLNPVTVPPTVYVPPPLMGQPDKTSAAAPSATIGNTFTLISGKSYNFLLRQPRCAIMPSICRNSRQEMCSSRHRAADRPGGDFIVSLAWEVKAI